jgi:DNA-directed RNA polymerase subunit N (RpoN/RPB10)
VMRFKEAIDLILKEKQLKDFDELLYYLEQQGYEIKRGKAYCCKRVRIRNASYDSGHWERVIVMMTLRRLLPVRWRLPSSIMRIIAELLTSLSSGKSRKESLTFSLIFRKSWLREKAERTKGLLPTLIQSRVAKAVLFLKQHDVRDYAKLEKIVNDASGHFNELSAAIKEREKRMAEIQVLRTHIINYMKTKEVYASYRKSGYSKKFLEAHRQEILLHKAAKKAFDELGVKKLPKVKELNAEFAELNAEKKQLFIEYRQAKKDMQDYQRAKYDIDQFLKEDERAQ